MPMAELERDPEITPTSPAENPEGAPAENPEGAAGAAREGPKEEPKKEEDPQTPKEEPKEEPKKEEDPQTPKEEPKEDPTMEKNRTKKERTPRGNRKTRRQARARGHHVAWALSAVSHDSRGG